MPTLAAFSTGVKYSTVAGDASSDDLASRDELLPFDPLPSSEDDIQFDHFMPFPHYLPKRDKRQAAPVSYSVSVNTVYNKH